ncbi:hypothetical protein OP10G_3959 [Fimbriimonas ginsengisoli Gsoil 348]|uniref:Uncharacterized protein n=1 Tax=Fimbriimonas ginsengisoli Gsoil 348 TaxID=661478 RepID=A0A068NVC7_FIMGI|nr:hypothetical protein OP10G_3959 [Fimbriimonas ginsengisoli Gsoil 348]
MAAQLAQDFSYLGWSFGTGPATSGTITLDRRQAATLPGNYDWAGEYIVSRYTYAYPSPMVDPPNPRLQGIAGTHTVPVANLRWIVRLIPGPLYVGDNFKPIWEKNAAWLGVPPDGLPFYWTESEDQSLYTSKWDTRGGPSNPNFPVWFDKYLGLISKSPIELPQNKTLTPNPTTYLQVFLAEIHYSGTTASVQVLDGFQTRYYAKWNQSNPGPYVNPTFTPTSLTGG